MPKMVHFGEFLKTWSLRSNSVTRQVSFNRTKIDGKCQNWKLQMRHFGWFSNNVHRLKSKGRSLGKFQVEQSQIASGQVCTTSSQAGKHSQNKHGWKEVATSVSFKIDFGVPFQLCTMYPNTCCSSLADLLTTKYLYWLERKKNNARNKMDCSVD